MVALRVVMINRLVISWAAAAAVRKTEDGATDSGDRPDVAVCFGSPSLPRRLQASGLLRGPRSYYRRMLPGVPVGRRAFKGARQRVSGVRGRCCARLSVRAPSGH